MEERNMNKADIKPKRILLVEDNHLNQLIMSRLLKKMDIEVVESNSGKEALKHAIQEKYYMIFICVFIPIDVGCETTENIRDLSLINKDIPIIAVSSNNDGSLNDEIFKCGITDIISKPFVEEELIALFNKYPEKSTSDEFRVFNSKAFESFYSDDKLKKEIISIFMSEKVSDLDRINMAFDSNDKNNIYETIHYMKGSFSYLKADNILELTQKILDLLKDNKLNDALLLKDLFINKYESLNEELNIYSSKFN